ncbi:MAG: VOC family protein [Alphaproteobacteria bacterium]|nr:MAG: VOC family protein [Alphaproteobacteria bacterium]
MQLNPYIGFNGNCAEAMTFYADILGAPAPAMMTYGQMPPMPEGEAPEGCGDGPAPDLSAMADKVMHAQINGDGFMIMGADAPFGHYKEPQGVNVALQVPTAEEAERVFARLSEGGTVIMPIAETFWAHRFGMFQDRFAVYWMINCLKDFQPE